MGVGLRASMGAGAGLQGPYLCTWSWGWTKAWQAGWSSAELLHRWRAVARSRHRLPQAPPPLRLGTHSHRRPPRLHRQWDSHSHLLPAGVTGAVRCVEAPWQWASLIYSLSAKPHSGPHLAPPTFQMRTLSSGSTIHVASKLSSEDPLKVLRLPRQVHFFPVCLCTADTSRRNEVDTATEGWEGLLF